MGEKFGNVLAEKKVTLSRLLNSNMAKHEIFDHLHLVSHIIVPLKSPKTIILAERLIKRTSSMLDHMA